VVPNTAGMVKDGNPAIVDPCAKRAHRAINAPVTTPMVGAKFETASRTVLLKNVPRRSFFRVVAIVYVAVAVTSVSKAFVKVDAELENVRPMSETASTTKMALMSVENISSVNLVRYLTRLDAEVSEETNRIAEDQRPVQA
jgi:hypothetical protein